MRMSGNISPKPRPPVAKVMSKKCAVDGELIASERAT